LHSDFGLSFGNKDGFMRNNSLFRRLVTSSVSILTLAAFALPAASVEGQNRVPDRIPALVSDYASAPIPGSVHPKARLATDLGPEPGDTKLVGMSLRFTPSAAQQAALDQLLSDQQNPASPLYHQWLTPQQYAAQFGLSAADLASITDWLTRQGFTVTGVAQGGSFVTFDGTVAQAQVAFSTSIHSLSLNGETHFANITDASVPSAFSGVVGAITGLHDFRPKPHLHSSLVRPNFTSSLSENHYIAPGDIYTIYDTQPLLNAGITGAGITIAVMGQVDINLADVTAFRSASGLSTTNLPTTKNAGTDPGPANNCSPTGTNKCPSPNLDDLGESSLDVEWTGAMAPLASILFVNGHNVFDNSMTQAIDQNLAPIVTVSYGDCEALQGTSVLSSYNQLFKQASAQGQTILAASGDEGATDCESSTSTSATTGLAVDFPGDSPYVTSMGGTMFNEGSATGVTTYWNSNSLSSSDNSGSAIQYIPEAAWNNASYNAFGGGGGGVSAYFSKPAWQVETGATGMTTQVPPDSSRDVPDLAMDASDAHDTYLYCYDGSCVNGFRYTDSSLTTAGGTSFVAPIFSGMLALIEQKNNIPKGAGNINPLLYALGNNATYYNTTSTSVFHDVTTGNNAMPCIIGTVNCPNGGSIGYNAGTGYDLTTGWGSVDLNNLAGAWNWAAAHPEGLGTLGPNLSATTLTASSTSVAAGSTDTLTATVSSATLGFTTPPTGSVQFLVNNVALGSPVALVGGVATYPYIPTCSALGQQSITAVYSGDVNYQGSKGPSLSANSSSTNSPLIVTVTAGPCSSFSLSSSAPLVNGNPTITVAAGGTIPAVTITVASANGFAGTVVFSFSGTTSTGYDPTVGFSPASITLNSTTTSGTTTLTLSGITAGLRLPNAPGSRDSGTMFAQQNRTHSRIAEGCGIALASLLLLVLPRRRRLSGLLMLALSFALIGGATGCGGSNQSTPPATNPYAGVYVVNVFGTYTSSTNAITTQSTTVTYNIN
jgi:hypothetical protein